MSGPDGELADIPELDAVNASRWTDFTGETIEETREDGWLAAVHPDDREAARATWNRMLSERVPAVDRFREPDGAADNPERQPAQRSRVDVGQELVAVELVEIETVDDPDRDRDEEHGHRHVEQIPR